MLSAVWSFKGMSLLLVEIPQDLAVLGQVTPPKLTADTREAHAELALKLEVDVCAADKQAVKGGCRQLVADTAATRYGSGGEAGRHVN